MKHSPSLLAVERTGPDRGCTRRLSITFSSSDSVQGAGFQRSGLGFRVSGFMLVFGKGLVRGSEVQGSLLVRRMRIEQLLC